MAITKYENTDPSVLEAYRKLCEESWLKTTAHIYRWNPNTSRMEPFNYSDEQRGYGIGAAQGESTKEK